MLRQPLLDRESELVEVRDRISDRDGFTIELHDRDARGRGRGYGFYLIPCCNKFSICDPVLINRYRAPLLHHPTDHREDVDDQERAREDEVHELLLNVEKEQRRHEKKEGKDGHDRGPLQ